MRIECVILRNYTLSSGHEIETIRVEGFINVHSPYLRTSVRDRSANVKEKNKVDIAVGKTALKRFNIETQTMNKKLFADGYR